VPGSRVKLLTLTDEGLAFAAASGIPIASSGRTGLEHEFWRARLKERCEARGYTVTSEYLLLSGGRVDLHATKGGRTFLIEVETGKSDVKRNIEKCAGNNATLIVFFTNEQALRTARGAIVAYVVVLSPETLNQLHGLLIGFTG